jgi:hypothetical protein
VDGHYFWTDTEKGDVMKLKSLLAVLAAVGLSLLAAGHRWGDSSHAIGLVTAAGGKVRHPAVFEGEWDRYMQITTATVLPPFRGDARVVLEGERVPDYRLYYSEPVVNLGLKRIPRFENDILHDLRPGDRIALWVELTPEKAIGGTGARDPSGLLANPKPVKGGLRLSFYDTRTERPVLSIPFIFKRKKKGHDTSEQH